METAKKLIMITGSNKGIGFATIKALMKTNPEYRFLMCVRSMERGKAAVENLKKEFPDAGSRVEVHNLDISSSKSIDEFIEWVKTSKTKIDCLVNNAGFAVSTTDVTEDVMNKTFPTNYYGTVELTEKMIPLLPESSKIIIITSTLGSYKNLSDCTLKERLKNPKLTIEELKKIVEDFCAEVKAGRPPIKSGIIPVYSFTKLALNHYVSLLANEKAIKEKGIQVYACHPGWVKTDLAGPEAPLSLEEGAVCPSFVVNLPWKVDEKYQGKYFADCKVEDILE